MVMASKKDRYGYELANSISEKFAISEGTVYPVLRRLTKDDYFTTYLKESQEGPPRKYYRLTESGKGEMLELINEWRTFSDGVERIIKEGLTDVEK